MGIISDILDSMNQGIIPEREIFNTESEEANVVLRVVFESFVFRGPIGDLIQWMLAHAPTFDFGLEPEPTYTEESYSDFQRVGTPNFGASNLTSSGRHSNGVRFSGYESRQWYDSDPENPSSVPRWERKRSRTINDGAYPTNFTSTVLAGVWPVSTACGVVSVAMMHTVEAGVRAGSTYNTNVVSIGLGVNTFRNWFGEYGNSPYYRSVVQINSELSHSWDPCPGGGDKVISFERIEESSDELPKYYGWLMCLPVGSSAVYPLLSEHDGSVEETVSLLHALPLVQVQTEIYRSSPWPVSEETQLFGTHGAPTWYYS